MAKIMLISRDVRALRDKKRCYILSRDRFGGLGRGCFLGSNYMKRQEKNMQTVVMTSAYLISFLVALMRDFFGQ